MGEPAAGSGYMASAALPRKARHEPLESRAAWRHEIADRVGVGRAEGVELLRMDRAGDEQQVEPGVGGADSVGADAVADGEDAAALDREPGGRIGQPQRFVVDRPVWLAGHADAAAMRLVEVGQGAAAIDDAAGV